MTHWPARTGPAHPPGCPPRCYAARRGRRPGRRRSRAPGAIVSTAATPMHPDRMDAVESAPVHRVRARPRRSRHRRARRASACPSSRAAHAPGDAIPTTAPVSAAPSTAITSSSGTVTMPAIVFATALPSSSGPSMLPPPPAPQRCPGGRPACDQGGDGVRRVVNPVGERERQRHRHGDNKLAAHHGDRPTCGAPVRRRSSSRTPNAASSPVGGLRARPSGRRLDERWSSRPAGKAWSSPGTSPAHRPR